MRLTDAARSVAANAKSANILADKVGRFIGGEPSRVVVASTASAAGMRISILLGNVTVVDDQEISRANRFPILPDDVVAQFGAVSDELLIFLRNTTAGALTADTTVDIDPL